MNGARIPRLTRCIVLFLFSVRLGVSLPAFADDSRGPAGLPPYIRSPQDRPPPAAVDPMIVGPNLSIDGILATIPREDSVIVIRGKVEMGGRDYHSAYPEFRGGSLLDAMKGCKREYRMKPQYRKTETEGYAMFVIVKDTATDQHCWNQFRTLDTLDLSCDRIMVKTTETSEPAAWDNPSSSYANSYDLRTFRLEAVSPR